MFYVIVGALAVLVIVWRSVRRRRQDVRAGLIATRPQFVSDPPRRFLDSPSGDVL